MIISRGLKSAKFNPNGLTRQISSRRRKDEVFIPPAKRLAEPWNERKNVWKTKFQFFEPKTPMFGPDMLTKLQTPLDLSPQKVKKWYERRMKEQDENDQKFIHDRLEILGADLAAAHFIVHRGGAIRFVNEKEWVEKKEDGTYDLPKVYMPGLFVEAIDLRDLMLRRCGLENILDLSRLLWLRVAGNEGIDDWSLDAISGSYCSTLQYLDISRCQKVSHRALSCFYRFDKLDTLVVEGIANTPEFKLSCMMLEDLKPRLTIKGIDHTIDETTPGQ